MMVVIQRVSEASVQIGQEISGQISKGFLILLGIAEEDGEEDIDWLCKKIVQLRIFGDAEDKMNLSLLDCGGEVLLISQFTLHAETKKGNRPSFIRAARPEKAIPLYRQFILTLEKELRKPIQTGKFGANMKVSLVNDGPVTILMDSKNRK